ncbi:hypothetical protein ACQCVP_10930 [Rossellomorea vietnamensis]|uniref:hypothetical protein n=1 Tax=Rossellomorea vietnamensis TaxID=218284 RepID=UPI003CF1A2E0
MFRREKKAVFPFILFGLFDPEGLGAGTGLGVSPVPLVPQEVAHPPLQTTWRKKYYSLPRDYFLIEPSI